jgi:hypothetical protein
LLIDEIYAFNCFYREAPGLVHVPPSEIPLLMATVLLKSATNYFQRSALLLANLPDALLELIDVEPKDDAGGGDESSLQAEDSR